MVSIDTLGNDAIIFVRDVLRQNLTDRYEKGPARSGSDWIYKSRPATVEINLPFVIVTQDSERADRLTFEKLGIPFLRLDIRVWAHKINHRDEIADEIVKILKDEDSADSNGTTIKQNYLKFKRYEKYEEDGFIDGFPAVMRIKRVMMDFKYIGG